MTRQLIIGMPDSGKSTYIGALYHILVAAEVTTDNELEMTWLSDEGAAHLARLEAEWLDCKPVAQTTTGTEGWVELQVRNRSTGSRADSFIPNMRGEAFQEAATIGRC